MTRLVLSATNKGDDQKFYQEMHSICQQINQHIQKMKNINKLPAPAALRKKILETCTSFNDSLVLPELNTEEEINNFYDQDPPNDFKGYIQDAEGEVRDGEVETKVEQTYNRNYEVKSVAAKIGDDWIGWNYFYGGGKHGSPEEVPWIDYAYYLTCEEKEVLTIQRTWAKV